uniref:Uncharacterized protein n=1 Tax=Oryza sativa subsp. japonica TaxID=39947 RepID=Q8W5E5_ORYSJ|nr:hypothetical protein [Oryza sativa Japonica Group]AAN04153.1 Hypothetical protein [Oryza sativa Japonica Group]
MDINMYTWGHCKLSRRSVQFKRIATLFTFLLFIIRQNLAPNAGLHRLSISGEGDQTDWQNLLLDTERLRPLLLRHPKIMNLFRGHWEKMSSDANFNNTNIISAFI